MPSFLSGIIDRDFEAAKHLVGKEDINIWELFVHFPLEPAEVKLGVLKLRDFIVLEATIATLQNKDNPLIV